MSVIDLVKEARRLKKGEDKEIVKSDDFDIGLMDGPGKLHVCGKDEFFWVLKGEGELLIDGRLHVLEEGHGIMIRAGEKHQRVGSRKVCWLIVSKHPHKHVFFET